MNFIITHLFFHENSHANARISWNDNMTSWKNTHYTYTILKY